MNKSISDEVRQQAKKEKIRHGNFILARTGVYHVEESSDGDEKELLICSRLEISAAVRDGESEKWGRLLKFKDLDGQPHEWAMPMRMLNSDGAELRRVLLDNGLCIQPGKARNLLSVYLQTWPVKKRALAAEQTGWLNNSFVLPQIIIGTADGDIVFQSDGMTPKHFKQQGTLEEWQENVAALCVGNSRLIFSVCCALAAPLLHICKEENGGVHLRGGSSTGKSTALYVAASVCGPPEYKQQWRATANGLEATASIHNDAVLILDELSQVDAREAGETAYMLANGRGKQRARRTGAARESKEWRLLFLSSGEVNLSTHMAEKGRRVKAGQEVRMVDIPADAGAGLGLFENIHSCTNGAEFSIKIKNAAADYFGTPFISFLQDIVEKDFAELSADLDKMITGFADTLCGDGADGQARRVARRFGLIAAAGLLANELGVTGWDDEDVMLSIEKCFLAWVDARGGFGDVESNQLKQQVKGFLEKHGNSRFTKLSDDLETLNVKDINRAGFYEVVDGVTEYYVLPVSFKEVIEGFELRQATGILAAAGWLESDKEGKHSIRKTLPGLGRTRCYHLTKNIWN